MVKTSRKPLVEEERAEQRRGEEREEGYEGETQEQHQWWWSCYSLMGKDSSLEECRKLGACLKLLRLAKGVGLERVAEEGDGWGSWKETEGPLGRDETGGEGPRGKEGGLPGFACSSPAWAGPRASLLGSSAAFSPSGWLMAAAESEEEESPRDAVTTVVLTTLRGRRGLAARGGAAAVWEPGSFSVGSAMGPVGLAAAAPLKALLFPEPSKGEPFPRGVRCELWAPEAALVEAWSLVLASASL
jgi:hypothetical protein